MEYDVNDWISQVVLIRQYSSDRIQTIYGAPTS